LWCWWGRYQHFAKQLVQDRRRDQFFRLVPPFTLSSTFNSSPAFLPAPQIAGAAALILQARGKSNEIVFAMKDILESTASPVPSNLTDTNLPQTLIIAGAGLIQVDRAAFTTTLASPGHLSLNDTAHFQPM
jgi:hypothetical protein